MSWEGLLRMSFIPGPGRYVVLGVHMLGRCWGKSFSFLDVEKQEMEVSKAQKVMGFGGSPWLASDVVLESSRRESSNDKVILFFTDSLQLSPKRARIAPIMAPPWTKFWHLTPTKKTGDISELEVIELTGKETV
jgi:hypothetical protein